MMMIVRSQTPVLIYAMQHAVNQSQARLNSTGKGI